MSKTGAQQGFDIQTQLLSDISSIVYDEAERVSQLTNTDSPLEDQIISEVCYFNLKDFAGLVSYFSYQRQKGLDDKFYRFLLPNIRQLIEIYANLLYLLNETPKEAAQFCAITRLATIAKTIRLDGSASSKVDELKRQYCEDYSKYNILIGSKYEQIQDYGKLSNKYISDNKLLPSVEQKLKSSWIVESCPDASRIFSGVERHYKFYDLFSNYVHANDLFSGFYGKEKYWVVVESLVLSALCAELVDRKLLHCAMSDRLNTWRQMLISRASSVTKEWEGARVNF